MCLMFAVVFMFGTAFVASAEEEYLTSFKVSGTNSMTLTFGTSSGQTISVDLGAVLLMPMRKRGTLRLLFQTTPISERFTFRIPFASTPKNKTYTSFIWVNLQAMK